MVNDLCLKLMQMGGCPGVRVWANKAFLCKCGMIFQGLTIVQRNFGNQTIFAIDMRAIARHPAILVAMCANCMCGRLQDFFKPQRVCGIYNHRQISPRCLRLAGGFCYAIFGHPACALKRTKIPRVGNHALQKGVHCTGVSFKSLRSFSASFGCLSN